MTTNPNTAHVAVGNLHAIATLELEQIAAIARLALQYMQAPDAYRHPEPIAQALQAITDKAEMAADTVAGVAERAGSNWQDRDQYARMRAQDEAQDLQQPAIGEGAQWTR